MEEVNELFEDLRPQYPTTTTSIKIGGNDYHIELSEIPYLAAFANFERTKAQNQQKELVHGPIAHFDTALEGMEFGFRQCFRSIPPDLAQHHALCETYEFLCIDVLGGKSLNEIIGGLKTGRRVHKGASKSSNSIKRDRSKARDSAFQLLYFILRGEFEDEMKDSTDVYNAVMFIVSHADTFQWRTRKVVRAAYEDRFVVSVKQIAGLNKWEEDEDEDDEDDVMSEEEESISSGYYSDYDPFYN
ncbi:hypothetical protein V499_08484 [Pseudogymnoascus sp. VKM F-103]|uniref:Uncharacterized protein n=1 Tax=Pseudogymnoascus verrucosus TaxID=342668 RepID=A0A1B8GNU3_9PEZI|nr:uncharacterized protein VE01_04570 [Pseudogymnoascus verrucosus]KFY71320.1 hypothetical protein V499_08484 [Pseudogymnoascus sp. VKM F-103]OBT97515.1 hypothetical protein VE01_04570 [Pseudogymnoascus verrucosus]